ncbi:MAG TPA: nitroreductase [Acidimicrobiales bacterium]|nr:nitroreductase [Acidimicrobiales bacterium]
MDALDAIFARRSIGRLQPPAPTPEDLDTILRAAAVAPDHKTLRPWKFVVLDGDAKDAFGGVLADAYRARTLAAGKEIVAAKEDKERTKLGRAPLVVVVGAVNRGEDSIPFIEQYAAAAAASQNMLIAATALGYGSMWRTGDPAYDDDVKAALGFSEDDAIVGFLYLGTPTAAAAKHPNEADLTDLVTRWRPQT